MSKVVTSFIYPPIPVRNMDWQVVLDNYDGTPDSHSPMGHGTTERIAVLTLREACEMRDDLEGMSACEQWLGYQT